MLAGVVARDGPSGGRSSVRRRPRARLRSSKSSTGSWQICFAEGPSAIGVGVPMNLDRRTGIGFGAVNLPLRSLDLAAHLQARFSIPVGVENDGNAIALAEWRVGAGQGANDLVALALGTGVGGGRHRRRSALPRLGRARPRRRSGRRAAVPGELPWARASRGRRVRRGSGARGGRAVGRGRRRPSARTRSAGRPQGRSFGALADRALPRRRDRLLREHLRPGGRRRRRWFRHGGVGLPLQPAEEAARREALHPADNELRIVQAALGDDAGLVGAGLVGFEALDGLR